MSLKNKIKNFAINYRKTSLRSVVKKNGKDKIDVEKSLFVVVIDADDYTDNTAIDADVNIIHNELKGSVVIVCDGNSEIPEKDITDVKIITFEDVSLLGKLNTTIINEICRYNAHVLIAIKPLKSRLSKLVASSFETSLSVTVSNDCSSNQYDIVIKENSKDTKKKITTIIFYLKQLNIRR